MFQTLLVSVKRKWKCTRCGYIHMGDEPPEMCPMPDCGAPREAFVEITEAPVKG